MSQTYENILAALDDCEGITNFDIEAARKAFFFYEKEMNYQKVLNEVTRGLKNSFKNLISNSSNVLVN